MIAWMRSSWLAALLRVKMRLEKKVVNKRVEKAVQRQGIHKAVQRQGIHSIQNAVWVLGQYFKCTQSCWNASGHKQFFPIQRSQASRILAMRQS